MKKKIIIGLILSISVTIATLAGSQPVYATTIVNKKCTGFNYSGKTTPKKYCAHYLYSNNTTVKSACPVAGSKGNCQDKVRQNLYGNSASGMTTEQLNSNLDSYASSVADILISTNMEYCESLGNGTATTECEKSSSWRDYYYEDYDATIAPSPSSPSSPSKPSDGDDDGDGSTGNGEVASVAEGSCASILTAFCNDDGIESIIRMIVAILTGAVVVAGTVGIIICGFLWMTARDNEAQVAQAKKRMMDIVIGIIAWVLLAFVANLFIPKSSSDIESDLGVTNSKGVQG